MSQVDLSAPRPVRVGVFVAVGLLHLLAVLALVRAFAPGFVAATVDSVVSTFSVTITAPEPSPTPTPPPPPAKAETPAGAAGAAGRRATPREVTAPKPRVDIPRRETAPVVASTGSANSAGARDEGNGTGAGGQGSGTGSGGSGNGTGGGAKAVKIAGDINSARDYPIASRDQRIGDYVIVWLTVGTDGRPTDCKVARPSRDSEANAITCRLALERFRFRPATDGSGQPVVSTWGWQQKWFYKP
jgi:protein TonB